MNIKIDCQGVRNERVKLKFNYLAHCYFILIIRSIYGRINAIIFWVKESIYMKKFIFGVLIVLIGLIFGAFCFIYAAINPWNYNGIEGIMGSLLGTHMLVPFIISIIIMLVGLSICYYEAYRKNE